MSVTQARSCGSLHLHMSVSASQLLITCPLEGPVTTRYRCHCLVEHHPVYRLQRELVLSGVVGSI